MIFSNKFNQQILPHVQINKLAKKIAHCNIRWIKNLLIYFFIKKYKVNLQEAAESNPFAYKNFNDFFTRELKSNARSINHDLNTIISPCDGYITQYGEINQRALIQTKTYKLPVKDLLAINLHDNQIFINGKFITIYLAPHNYHRIHMPITATLKKMIYVPGKLFSVNPKIVDQIPNIFTINERVISIFDSEIGRFAIILVGAMIVGNIVTSWHGEVIPDQYKTIQTWDYNNKNLILKRGNEIGLFKLGSTVIMLFENSFLNFFTNWEINHIVKMGDQIFLPNNKN